MSWLRHTRFELFLNVCAVLDREGIDWCVLSGHGISPDETGLTDVDVMVRPEHFGDVPRAIAKLAGVHIVQCRLHNATSVRYEVVWQDPECSPILLGVDVSSDLRALGTVLMSAQEFLTGRRRFRNRLWIPHPSVGFGYYLLRRLAKCALYAQELTPGHEARLSKLYAEDPGGCNQQLVRFFPDPEARLIAAAATRRDWTPVRKDTARLLRAVVRKGWRAHPRDVLRYWLGEVPRRIQRVLHPAGLMVAFLGVNDRRTFHVMGRVQADLADAFGMTKVYHAPPLPRRRKEEDGPTSHERSQPRGLIRFALTLGLWWVAHAVGFLFDIFPRLVRTAFVLVDRRYYTPFADPAGSRNGRPLRLAQVIGWFAPRPHLIILLDGSPEHHPARMQESPHGGAWRRDDCAKRRGSHSLYQVDASKPADEVVADVERIILHYMRERVARRLELS